MSEEIAILAPPNRRGLNHTTPRLKAAPKANCIVKVPSVVASGIPVHCAHDRLVDVVSLIPNPRNPNRHPDKQVALLAKIIRAQGWRNPIVVSTRSGFVVKGHGRLQAAALLQVEQVPVDDQDYPNEAAEWADMLADNRIAELAETDNQVLTDVLLELDTGAFDMELTGFDAEALAFVMGAEHQGGVDAEAQIDRAGELQKKWGTATGQLWKLGEHRLLCGDSTKKEDVERVMGGEKAGLCFTSPPYAQQRDYGKKIDDWDSLMQGVFGIVPMADDGQVLVNLGLVHKDGEWWPYWDAWIEWMRTQCWKRFAWYVWDQGPGMPGDWGGRLAPSFEFVFHFNQSSKHPSKARECKWAGSRHGGKGQRGADGVVKERTAGHSPVQSHAIHDSVIRVPRQGAQHGAEGHPAPYPRGLVTVALESWHGEVFDPFLGSGTTLIACENLKRKCRGIEVSAPYVAVCLERARQAFPEMEICLIKE